MLTRWKTFCPYPFQSPYPQEALDESDAGEEEYFRNFSPEEISCTVVPKKDPFGISHCVVSVNDVPYLDSRMNENFITDSALLSAFANCFLPNDWVMNSEPERFNTKAMRALKNVGIDAKTFHAVAPGQIGAYALYDEPLTVSQLMERFYRLIRLGIDKKAFDGMFRNPVSVTTECVCPSLRAESADEAYAIAELIRHIVQEKFSGTEWKIPVGRREFLISVLCPHCSESGEDFIVICDGKVKHCPPLAMCYYRAGNARISNEGISWLYKDQDFDYEPCAEPLGLQEENRIIPLTYLLERIAQRDVLFSPSFQEEHAHYVNILRDGCMSCLNPIGTIKRALKTLTWLSKRPDYNAKGYLTELAAFKTINCRKGGLDDEKL